MNISKSVETDERIEKIRPRKVDQNKVGARPMMEVMGTQIKPPMALRTN